MREKYSIDHPEMVGLIKDLRDKILADGRLVDKDQLDVYGVPNGGTHVAVWLAAQYPKEFSAIPTVGGGFVPDVVVDDIIESGKTKEGYKNWETPFHALIDKPNHDLYKGMWVHFPWETDHPSFDHTIGPVDAVVRLLEWVGEDPKREGLRGTPKRVVKALREMTTGYDEKPETVLKTVFSEEYDELILCTGIRFASLCEHHMLPFTGVASVGYIPMKTGGSPNVVGFSKLARIVHVYAKRLQIQERLTQQIAQAIQDTLKPEGVGVTLRAFHACMGCRGVVQPDASMVTSALLGCFRTDQMARSEFLNLAKV